jgi:hypothetical protein
MGFRLPPIARERKLGRQTPNRPTGAAKPGFERASRKERKPLMERNIACGPTVSLSALNAAHFSHRADGFAAIHF